MPTPGRHRGNAAQQAGTVENGVIIAVRNVGASATGLRIAIAPSGAFIPRDRSSSAGSILISTPAHATAGPTAFEYIVRKPGGDIVSVAQKDTVPLALGNKVLMIAGNQARVVPN